MKRPSNNNSRVGRAAIPTSMLDVILLVLAVTLIEAQFDVESVSLPNLVRTEPSATAGKDKAGSQIALRISGDVTYQGEPIALDEVPGRIKSEPDQNRPVLLSIETDEQGQGPSQALIQLMHDLSQSGVGHRVQVQYAKLKVSKLK